MTLENGLRLGAARLEAALRLANETLGKGAQGDRLAAARTVAALIDWTMSLRTLDPPLVVDAALMAPAIKLIGSLASLDKGTVETMLRPVTSEARKGGRPQLGASTEAEHARAAAVVTLLMAHEGKSLEEACLYVGPKVGMGWKKLKEARSRLLQACAVPVPKEGPRPPLVAGAGIYEELLAIAGRNDPREAWKVMLAESRRAKPR